MAQDENNQRSTNLFWRILTFPLSKIIIAVILVNVPTFIMRNLAQFILSALSVQNAQGEAFVVFIVRLLTVYFVYSLFVRYFEKRKADEISINRSALKEFSFGGILGLLTIVVVMGIMLIFRWYSIEGINQSATPFTSFLYDFFYAFLQDIVYFTIIFRVTEESLGSWIALVVASIIFGFKHTLFPGYNLWSLIAQSIEAGILFSTLFMLTRRIWVIFGFHFVWNYIEHGVVGIPEIDGMQGILISKFSGSEIFTGSPVGPEASILTFIVGLGLGIYFLNKVYRKGNFVLPFWKLGNNVNTIPNNYRIFKNGKKTIE